MRRAEERDASVLPVIRLCRRDFTRRTFTRSKPATFW